MSKWQRWGLRDTPFFQGELTYGPGAPHPVEGLMVGRDEEVQRALQVFEDEGDARCIVEGDPGVGKTSFVNRIKSELTKRGVRTEVDPIAVESTTTARQIGAEALRVLLRLRSEELGQRSTAQALATVAARATSRAARATDTFWADADARVNSRTTTKRGFNAGAAMAQAGFSTERSRLQADEPSGSLRGVFAEAVERFREEVGGPILFHIDNMEFLADQRPEAAALLIRDLRDFYTTPGTYWIFVGTRGLERSVFRHYTQVSGFFPDSIRLKHLGGDDVNELLELRYQILQRGTTPYVAPIHRAAVATLYRRYDGDLRNFLRLLETASTRSTGFCTAHTLTEGDILAAMAPSYRAQIEDAIGATALKHLEKVVYLEGSYMREFRQADMQARAHIKGPATRNALDVLVAQRVIEPSHHEGSRKFYRLTGEASIALQIPTFAA